MVSKLLYFIDSIPGISALHAGHGLRKYAGVGPDMLRKRRKITCVRNKVSDDT